MREIAVSIYLFSFNLIFTLFKMLPIKNKVVFVVSFNENTQYIYQQMKKDQINTQPIFLCRPRCYETFKETKELTYLFESNNMLHTIKGIYHLATAKKVIVDNYYGFLAVVQFKRGVECIQIWHAAGAIKQFGIMDPSNRNRSDEAVDRFKKVYAKFDRIVVGSDYMATIFQEAFLTNKTSFLRTGVPRTDFFFQRDHAQKIRTELIEANPKLRTKKVILYAPTFRKDEHEVAELPLNLKKMYEALKDDYILMLRLHPLVKYKGDITNLYPDFVFDYGQYPTVNDLLLVTDILISDYSSIPMEFAFSKRQMIFYAYDLESYEKANGFWEDYETNMPGPVVKTTEAVIEAILSEKIDIKQIEDFSKKWNEYSTGNSSERLVNYLFAQK